MSYIDSHLKENEMVIFRITRNQGILSIASSIIVWIIACTLFYIICYWISSEIFWPAANDVFGKSTDPGDWIAFILSGGLILLFAVALPLIVFFELVVIKFTAEIALTNQRVFGRGGRNNSSPFEIPIKDIESIRKDMGYIMIIRKSHSIESISRLFQHTDEFVKAVQQELIKNTQAT